MVIFNSLPHYEIMPKEFSVSSKTNNSDDSNSVLVKPGDNASVIGQRCIVTRSKAKATIIWNGMVVGLNTERYGLLLDEDHVNSGHPSSDGCYGGVRYYECAERRGLFVKKEAVQLGRSIKHALYDKYIEADGVEINTLSHSIVAREYRLGKCPPIELVGMDQVSQRVSQTEMLTHVGLCDYRITVQEDESDGYKTDISTESVYKYRLERDHTPESLGRFLSMPLSFLMSNTLVLDLKNNLIVDWIHLLRLLEPLKQLEDLDISLNNLSISRIHTNDKIANNDNGELNFGEMSSIFHFPAFSRLLKLSLRSCYLAITELPLLCNSMVSLRELDLSYNKYKSEEIGHSYRNVGSSSDGCESIKSEVTVGQTVNLSDVQNNNSGYSHMNEIEKVFKRLKVINLTGNTLTEIPKWIFSNECICENIILSENMLSEQNESTTINSNTLDIHVNNNKDIPGISSQKDECTNKHPNRSVIHLDVGSNNISTWLSISIISVWFPVLNSLVVTGNPICEAVGDTDFIRSILVSCLPGLKKLNLSTITEKQRNRHELWLLSKIEKNDQSILSIIPEHTIVYLSRKYRTEMESHLSAKDASSTMVYGIEKNVCNIHLLLGSGTKKILLPLTTKISTLRRITAREFGWTGPMKLLNLILSVEDMGWQTNLSEIDDVGTLGDFANSGEDIRVSVLIVD